MGWFAEVEPEITPEGVIKKTKTKKHLSDRSNSQIKFLNAKMEIYERASIPDLLCVVDSNSS